MIAFNKRYSKLSSEKDLARAILTALGGTDMDIENIYPSTFNDLLYAILKRITANQAPGGGVADTRLTNPHIIGASLYFDLLNVTTGSVIQNYESVPLAALDTSGVIKYIGGNYTLLPADDKGVLVFAPDRVLGTSLTLSFPAGLPVNFACTVIPKNFLLDGVLSFAVVPGAAVVLQNINGAFSSNIQCQQILVQSLGDISGSREYLLSFVEQTGLQATSLILTSQLNNRYALDAFEDTDGNGILQTTKL